MIANIIFSKLISKCTAMFCSAAALPSDDLMVQAISNGAKNSMYAILLFTYLFPLQGSFLFYVLTLIKCTMVSAK